MRPTKTVKVAVVVKRRGQRKPATKELSCTIPCRSQPCACTYGASPSSMTAMEAKAAWGSLFRKAEGA